MSNLPVLKPQEVVRIGMAMLYGYRLQVDAIEGGIVKIEAQNSCLKKA